MRERNITETEVRQAISRREKHGFYNPTHGTMNVQYRFPNMGVTLLVAYEELEDEVVVVTVIEE